MQTSCVLLFVFFIDLKSTLGFIIKFKNLNCEVYDQSLSAVLACRIKAISHTQNSVTIGLQVKRPIYNSKINLQLFQRASGWKPFLYKLEGDVCKFLASPKRNLIFYQVFKIMREFTNLNHSCPYTHDIWVKDVIVTNKTLDLPFPRAEYKLQATGKIKGKVWAEANVSVAIIESIDKL